MGWELRSLMLIYFCLPLFKLDEHSGGHSYQRLSLWGGVRAGFAFVLSEALGIGTCGFSQGKASPRDRLPTC